MTIGWRTPGAWVSGSTTATPGLPAGSAAGDRMVMFVGAKPFSATINAPAGWTRIGTQQTNGSVAAGVDTGSVTWSVFFRDWQSGDAAPTVSITSGNVALACIHGATKTAGAWATSTAYFGSDIGSGTVYSATAASSSGNIAIGDGLIHGTVIAGNDATFATPTIVATGAVIGTVTESPAGEGTTTTGNDLEASSASALVTTGTSSVDAVVGWTLSAAQTGGSALIRLREDRNHPSSGALVGPGATVAGTAARTRQHDATGALPGGEALVAGSAARTPAGAVSHAATGALVGAGAAMAGTAARTRQHQGTGSLAGPGAVVAGAAARTRQHAATSALQGGTGTVAGAAARTRQHAAAGALQGDGASLAGAAARTREHLTSGALLGGEAQVAGEASRSGAIVDHVGTGALVGPGSAVAGAAARTRAHQADGSLAGAGAAVAGTAARTRAHAATGALQADGAALTGLAARTRVHGTDGALVGPGAAVDGAAARTGPPVSHDASGALIGPGAVLAAQAVNGVAPPSLPGTYGGRSGRKPSRPAHDDLLSPRHIADAWDAIDEAAARAAATARRVETVDPAPADMPSPAVAREVRSTPGAAPDLGALPAIAEVLRRGMPVIRPQPAPARQVAARRPIVRAQAADASSAPAPAPAASFGLSEDEALLLILAELA